METTGRLPPIASPRLYTLTLKINPEEGTFTGRVIIDVEIIKPTKTLTLHALDLNIRQTHIHQKSDTLVADVATNEKDETIALTFPKSLVAGLAQVDILYSGRLNSQLRGLYEAEHNGQKFVFTQFEATDARRMFPCFDEPAMKARFSLTVTHPAHLTALSNMPVLEERNEEKYKTTRFDTTPVMSTYLLALALAPLTCKTIPCDGTSVSVWTLPEQLHLSEFALKVAANVLSRLNAYFDLPYPYPKLDLVAAPNFAMGAMENWGAIFFRDSCLLLSEPLAAIATKRDVANVITHEIVHQWFGNLVTMKWWDDLWLNESFATWLAVKIVDQWMPEWNSWTEFQQEKETPLFIDALQNTRPIQSEVSDPAQIEAMFDALTYEKGAACLRMIEMFLGEDVFRKGIRNYIKAFQYQNAAACDLWDALAAVSGQPVGEIARDWFTRPGFPLVTIRQDPNWATRFTLEQTRPPTGGSERTAPFGCGENSAVLGVPGHNVVDVFLSGPETSDASLSLPNPKGAVHSRPSSGPEWPLAPLWRIPFTFKYQDTRGLHSDRLLLTDRVTPIELPEPVTFLYGNVDEGGFFRVAYDSSLTNKLEAVLPDLLNPSERIGYLGHLWALTFSGVLPLTRFLDAVCRFKGDATRVVVEAVIQSLELLHDYIVTPDDLPLFRSWVHDFLTPIWNKTGWEPCSGEDEETRLMRATALWGLGKLVEEEEILSELPRRKTRYDALPASLDPTLVVSLLRLCARFDGGSLFDPFFKKYETAETPEERNRYLTALADFQKPALAIKLLERALTLAVRSQDVWKPVRFLLRNKSVRAETWEFVKVHWEAFHKKGGSVGANRMISATHVLWKPEWRAEVEQFFNIPSNRVDAAERTLAQTVEHIELGIRFKERERQQLSSWLRAR